jgi:hypothetical protein
MGIQITFHHAHVLPPLANNTTYTHPLNDTFPIHSNKMVTDFGMMNVCDMSRMPHCSDNKLTDGGEVVSLTSWLRFTPQNLSVLISVTGGVNLGDMMQLQGLHILKKINDPIGS